MAARKSCTHLTWAEAKANVGGSNGPGKKKPIPKKVSHDQALMQKVIAKNGGTQDAVNQQRSEIRRQRRAEERAAAAAAKRAEEKERSRAAESIVKPYEQSLHRLKERAIELRDETLEEVVECSNMDILEMKGIAQCIEMQLDEILALDAIFMDTDEFFISDECDLEELREKIDEWHMDEDDEELLKQIIESPLISFSLQLVIDDNRGESAMDLGAHVLLSVNLPQLYPLNGTAPKFKLSYFMVTDKDAVYSADKPLESLAYIEEEKLLESLEMEAKQMLPDPCVYEMASTWLTENLFEYVVMHSYGDLANKE